MCTFSLQYCVERSCKTHQTIIDEINAHKKQLEEEKISNGFLEEADKRAELLLISHYSSNGYDEVIIEFY